MASWFKGKSKDGGNEDSTIQVEAQVIENADAAAPVELVDDFRVEPALVSIAPELYDQALDERRALVTMCLYAHDRARSSGVAERIEEGLAAVGVEAVRPDGAKFDPSVHEAGGTSGTEDEALDGPVAETEVVGFSDCGQVLRPPIVTFYTSKATTP